MKIAKAFAIAGLLTAATLPGAALEPKSSCQALDVWVSQLATLPADYASFTALEPDQRRAVFNRLSDAERSVLWRHQLRMARAEEGLTVIQRELIAEAARLLTPESYAASRARGGADFQALQDSRESLEQRVAQAFSRQEARPIFYQLGPPAVGSAAAGFLFCNCSLQSAGGADCPPESQICREQGCSGGIGCGFGGTEWCGGVCHAS